jgi:hypothetical protein
VRIYEATDAMNLNQWNLVEEFDAAKKDCLCMSWNPSPFDAPMMVVGTEATARVCVMTLSPITCAISPPLGLMEYVLK